jgi:hypothetical protein
MILQYFLRGKAFLFLCGVGELGDGASLFLGVPHVLGGEAFDLGF